MQTTVILPDERTSLPAVVEILLVLEDEADIVLAADQDDRRVGAELLDLLVPHRHAVVQRVLTAHIEAHEDHVRSTKKSNKTQ